MRRFEFSHKSHQQKEERMKDRERDGNTHRQMDYRQEKDTSQLWLMVEKLVVDVIIFQKGKDILYYVTLQWFYSNI